MFFSFGYGYVAQSFGGTGTSRTAKGKGQLIYNGGPLSKEILEEIEKAKYILITISPQNGRDILAETIQKNLSYFRHIKWVGYISSTNVYGDYQGEWVNEESATKPTSEYGLARLKAERDWLGLDLPVHVFRLAGIYGPGRNVLEKLKNGTAQRIFKEGVVFSRIHLSDIHHVIQASIKKPAPGRIYNVADNLPAPSHEVITYGAKLLGIEPPPLISFEEADLSPLGRSFYQDSKRVCNKRILKELISTLKYPTYREGLKSLIN